MLELGVGQRKPLHWADKSKPYEVKIGLNNQQDMDGWSSPFRIQETGTIFLEMWLKDGSKHLFKVTKREVSSTMFLFVYDIENDHAPIVIRNKIDWLLVEYF